MNTKEFILEQMSACYNKKNWFVPLTDALAGLSFENALWNNGSGNHSIWQIVNHLIFWNERWLMRFRGEVPPKMEGENSETFTQEQNDNNWKQSEKKLFEVLNKWEERLKQADEDLLKNEAFPGYGASWYEVFAQMTIHNAYHSGQIVYIRKQQGSWDSGNGVK